MQLDPAELFARMKDIETSAMSSDKLGAVANYIPELARIDPRYFAISTCLPNGVEISVGDADTPFSIQSISKVFTLSLALGRLGDAFWSRVGREASVNVFNSAQELEFRAGIPANPFVNAGAIVTTDALLGGLAPKEVLGEILKFIRQAADDDEIFVDQSTASSEIETGHQNWALAHILRGQRNLDHACELTLGTYFHQCAILMTTRQLAKAGRYLAGFHPTGTLISKEHVRSINALMMTCGHYNGSGEFAYRVGIPAKSGVGGGILAIVPGQASICVWSPGLDILGNSLRGTMALQALSRAFDLSIFLPRPA